MSREVSSVSKGLPRFMCFDGVDFTGKSTQVAILSDYLNKRGIKNTVTREPGGTEFGESIRDLVFANPGISAETAFMLFNASRIEHIRQKIQPAIERGEVVICDRFLASTIVYQGILKSLGVELVREVHGKLCHDICPDITFVMDIDIETVASRKSQDTLRIGNYYDEIQQKDMEVKINAFRNLDNFPFKCQLIDASKSIEDVATSVRSYLGI